MTLDHSLGSKEVLDLVPQLEHVAVLPQPVRTLGAEAQAFETETNTGGTETLFIWLFITFLSTDPARVAARLGAHGTLCFWRSGAPGSRRELSRRLWSRGHKD